MLDREGNPIESQFNYTLEPAQSSLPMTPMTLQGMYFIWLMRRPSLIARPENVSWWRITQSWAWLRLRAVTVKTGVTVGRRSL